MITNKASGSLQHAADDEEFDAETPTYRQLPRNIEAERGLLGAIFVDNRALEQVSEFLVAEHFALTAHARIYEAMMKLIDRGQIADPTTLRPYFEADNSLQDILAGPSILPSWLPAPSTSSTPGNTAASSMTCTCAVS